MRARVQRVCSAEVISDGELLGKIAHGLFICLGVDVGDTAVAAERLAEKIVGLRIFEDAGGKLNLSVRDVGGDVLAISNFALMADVATRRRPPFAVAAEPGAAQPLYDRFVASLSDRGCRVACGPFARQMNVTFVADGPANLLLEILPFDRPQ